MSPYFRQLPTSRREICASARAMQHDVMDPVFHCEAVGAVRRTGFEREEILERTFGPLLPGLESTFVDAQAGNVCVKRLARDSKLFGCAVGA
jgi:hypothetical protein